MRMQEKNHFFFGFSKVMALDHMMCGLHYEILSGTHQKITKELLIKKPSLLYLTKYLRRT
jgi:hypothetical protein